MMIKVKLFAMLREKAGRDEIPLELADGARVSDAVRELLKQMPGLETWISKAAYAVNLSRVNGQAILKDGDELALLPPVSGG